MTRNEIFANSNLLTFAGSESSANTTASLLFRIAADETLRTNILKELHSSFNSEDDITSTRAMALPYMRAVIEESLRLHPVTPNALWRETPKEGNQVLGDWIPGNVSAEFGSHCATINLTKNRQFSAFTIGYFTGASTSSSGHWNLFQSDGCQTRELTTSLRTIEEMRFILSPMDPGCVQLASESMWSA
jgi:hypothetical protein